MQKDQGTVPQKSDEAGVLITESIYRERHVLEIIVGVFLAHGVDVNQIYRKPTQLLRDLYCQKHCWTFNN